MTSIIGRLFKGVAAFGVLAGCLVAAPARAGVIVEAPRERIVVRAGPVFPEVLPIGWGDRWDHREGRDFRYGRYEPRHFRNCREVRGWNGRGGCR